MVLTKPLGYFFYQCCFHWTVLYMQIILRTFKFWIFSFWRFLFREQNIFQIFCNCHFMHYWIGSIWVGILKRIKEPTFQGYTNKFTSRGSSLYSNVWPIKIFLTTLSRNLSKQNRFFVFKPLKWFKNVNKSEKNSSIFFLLFLPC
jgi:hypothetical protein